jgi:SAM-dependent methyltransferase
VDLVVTDLSHNMIVTCRAGFNRLAKPPLFAQMDAAKIGLEGKFNCIAHSMMIHWLDDMTGALENQRQMLTEKGQLFYATIGICHFNEWQHHLQQHTLDTPLRKDIPVNWPGCVKEEFIERDYGSGRNFLKMMSKTGANAPKPDYRKPSPKALKNACDTFDGKVTWHVVYGVLGG